MTFDISGVSPDSIYYANLDNSIVYAQSILSQLAQDSTIFCNVLQQSFGSNYDATIAESLRTAWASGDFSNLPQIVVLSSGMDNCLAAYAPSTNTIYINQSLIDGSQSADFINDILLEEIGHGINNITNANSTGETGAIFSTLAQGGTLTSDQIAAYQAESDWGTITVNGQPVTVQMQVSSARFSSMSPDNGSSNTDYISNDSTNITFTVSYTGNPSGGTIYLFDGTSQLASKSVSSSGNTTFTGVSLSAGTHTLYLQNSSGSTKYNTKTVIIDTIVPTISSGATASVAEHVVAGTTVYTIAATDTGGAGVDSYALSGTDAASFTVDSTGVVTINTSPQYATKPSYSFNVTATDKAGNTSTATGVNLSITNVAPSITPVTISYTDSVNDDPFSASSGTITASSKLKISLLSLILCKESLLGYHYS